MNKAEISYIFSNPLKVHYIEVKERAFAFFGETYFSGSERAVLQLVGMLYNKNPLRGESGSHQIRKEVLVIGCGCITP